MHHTPDEVISIPGRPGSIPLEVFTPRGAGPFPAVLVIHEMLGLNADMRRIARRFADHGYLAACPDLMAAGSRIGCVLSAMRSLRRGQGPQVEQLTAALDALRRRADTAGVGVAGFCMGGGFATLLATHTTLDAAAVFYGDLRPKEEFASACPIVAGYGARDRQFGSKGQRLEAYLAGHGIPHDVRTYADAGHSFMSEAISKPLALLVRPWMLVEYNEAAAEDSWRRMLAFFGEHLGGAA